MAGPKVYFVHLRRPRRNDQNEQRDDPYYEFGSFGCTGCHSSNLFHPRHAQELEGARLAFVQGGQLGTRLVFLTPPISVEVWSDRCEAKWTPCEMPFKYAAAPILACNSIDGDFPLIELFAGEKKGRSTIEGGLSSRLRSLARPLSVELARHVVKIYERKCAKAAESDFASAYDEALPYAPPKIDRNRKATYESRVKKLRGVNDVAKGAVNMGESESERQFRSRCGGTRRRPRDPLEPRT